MKTDKTTATITLKGSTGALPNIIECKEVIWPDRDYSQIVPVDEQSSAGYMMSSDIPVGSIEMIHWTHTDKEQSIQISYKAKNNWYTRTFEGHQFEVELK